MKKLLYEYKYKVYTVFGIFVLLPYVLLSSIIITIGFTLLYIGCFMLNFKPKSFTEWSDIKYYWKFW